MKTLVLMQHAVDNRPVLSNDSTEITYKTRFYLMDKWGQTFDVIHGHDKVLDEDFDAIEVYGENYHAEDLESLWADMRERGDIAVVTPFEY